MPDEDPQWMSELLSDDERTRVRALHAACPCSGSMRRWEDYMGLLRQMTKDPSPAVRAVAIHLEEDALGHLQIEDGLAEGVVRYAPGHSGSDWHKRDATRTRTRTRRRR
jgi:hypothetical protein